MVWTLPLSLPGGWRIVILRRQGSDITQQEIDNYFAGTIYDDIYPLTIDGEEYPGATGISDYDVQNNLQYYYRAVLQDTSDDAVSTTVGANATAKVSAETSIIDAKQFVLTAVERVMLNYGMVKDEHYQLVREYGLPGMKAPLVYVTRVGGQVLHRFLGYFRQLTSNLKEIYGEIEMDNIQVVWEDPNAVRRDRITNIFRESKEFIRQYLINEHGADMDWVEILIEGDVINEAVRDRIQLGGMMMISCAISSEAEMQPNLASWLSGLGEPQN